MYRKICGLLFCVSILLFAASYGFAQTGNWMRVGTDDGEFSIDVPAENSFFSDEDGFTVGYNAKDYRLKKMEMLNAYTDGTLISFERYEGPVEAVQKWIASDLGRKPSPESEQVQGSGIKMRQVTRKLDVYTSITRYFYSKKHVYVLTAAAREGETAAMKRFFDSMTVQFAGDGTPAAGVTVLSSLPKAAVKFEQETPPIKDPPKPDKDAAALRPQQNAADPTLKKLTIVAKPMVDYTEAARAKRVTGRVVLSIMFDKDGFIPQITLKQGLPEGLIRQAIFAAMRIKFLPEEKDGLLAASTRTVEYSFSIY